MEDYLYNLSNKSNNILEIRNSEFSNMFKNKQLKKDSILALPSLLEKVMKNKISKFDLIIINDDKSFEKLILEFFYSDNILKIDGIIILTNINKKPMKSVYNYLNKNYIHYKNEIILDNAIFTKQNQYIQKISKWYFFEDFSV
jgi:predicted O-methyltransferase YrrM